LERQWETAGVIHTIEEGCISHQIRIHLYALSFVDLALEDTVTARSTLAMVESILAPKPPYFMLSLIRHLLRCPIRDPERQRVHRELFGFIAHYILREPPFDEKDKAELDKDEEAGEEFEKRVEEAFTEVKTWDWGSTDQKYLNIVEKIICDCRRAWTLCECQD
jgi:hypothetical protein